MQKTLEGLFISLQTSCKLYEAEDTDKYKADLNLTPKAVLSMEGVREQLKDRIKSLLERHKLVFKIGGKMAESVHSEVASLAGLGGRDPENMSCNDLKYIAEVFGVSADLSDTNTKDYKIKSIFRYIYSDLKWEVKDAAESLALAAKSVDTKNQNPVSAPTPY